MWGPDFLWAGDTQSRTRLMLNSLSSPGPGEKEKEERWTVEHPDDGLIGAQKQMNQMVVRPNKSSTSGPNKSSTSRPFVCTGLKPAQHSPTNPGWLAGRCDSAEVDRGEKVHVTFSIFAKVRFSVWTLKSGKTPPSTFKTVLLTSLTLL